MSLQKQAIIVSFNQGVDTLTDPYQLPVGKFESLENSVFVQAQGYGRLNKRSGFGVLANLPDSTTQFLTTFNDGLIAVGKNLNAYAEGPSLWSGGLPYTSIALSTLPLSNSAASQLHIDTAISPSGLVLSSYADNVPVLSQVPPGPYGYNVYDKNSGAQILSFTQITPATGTLSFPFAPKSFFFGNHFVVVFGTTTGTTTGLLSYAAINASTLNTVATSTLISNTYFPMNTSSNSSFDGIVASNSLFLSWNKANNAGLATMSIGSGLAQSAVVDISSSSASIVSVTGDITQSPPTIWTSAYVIGTNTGQVVATNFSLTPLFSATSFTSSVVANLASYAQNGIMTSLQENVFNYNFSSSTSASNYVNTFNVNQSGGLTPKRTLIRSVGLASKGFIVNSTGYVLTTYASQYQSTYFLVGSTGQTVAKLAYGNGAGYVSGTLPSVRVIGSTASFGYTYKTTITPVNKVTNASSTTQTAGVLSSIGTALADLEFGSDDLVSIEAPDCLLLNGGYLWNYDGQTLAENGFHLWPEPTAITFTASGGAMQSQTYFYQVLYEWKDAKGNINRSSPSIPIPITTTSLGSSGATGKVTIIAPTLRVTGKTNASNSPVFIKAYRWSQTQQVYYFSASATNNLTSDNVQIIDNNTDAQILGNEILYTNGGVVENIAPPSVGAMTLWDSRAWVIDSEDPDTLWYSKPIIENVPIEMSDLFTYFVSPTTTGIGATGPCRCIFPLDDKLIVFKSNSLFYINGSGPDITGAGSQYTQTPIFITGGVGCTNQKSILMTPNGLLFQSDDKGMWQLGRDLSVQYIGKDVEFFNSCVVKSAVSVPGTNEVRFTLASSSQTLVYDYFVGQWDQFTGIPGSSSTVFNGKHTYLNGSQVFQETPGVYLDGSTATVIKFTTGWFNLAGLQGYARAYDLYLLGKFSSPHSISLGIAYDYNPEVVQTVNFSSLNTVGSGSAVEQWEINFQKQQCESFRLTFTETASGTAGAGVFLSGMNIVAGLKKQYPRNLGTPNRVG